MTVYVAGSGISALSYIISLLDKGVKISKVIIFEKRNHPGGNVWDLDGNRVYHVYGVHIFHTNSEKVLDFVKRFVDFKEFKYFAYAYGKDESVSYIPSSFYWLDKNKKEILKNISLPSENRYLPINKLDFEIYKYIRENYYEVYSRKVWGKFWDEALATNIFNRVRFWTNFNKENNYYSDRFTGIPLGGYHRMIHNMMDYIQSKTDLEIYFNTDALDFLNIIQNNTFVYTGDLDVLYERIFKERLEIPYVSIEVKKFENLQNITKNEKIKEKLLDWKASSASAFHLANNLDDFVRAVDYSKITSENIYTVDFFYQDVKNNAFKAYPVLTFNHIAEEAIKKLENLGIVMVGRLATYKYYNMDQAIASSTSKANKVNYPPRFNLFK